MSWYRRWPILSGVALIAITNVIALGGAVSNRSGVPDSTLTLTQRELELPYDLWRQSENSGLALRLVWRVDQLHDEIVPANIRFGGQGDWLDAAKLAELGIKVRPRFPRNADAPSYSSSVPADVLLVLEMDGPAYKRQLTRACKGALSASKKDAERDCAGERRSESRLFVVDAGLDRSALRSRYPNTKVYAIVRGQVEAAIVPDRSASHLVGSVRGVSVDEIQVPMALRAAFGVSGRAGRSRPADEVNPYRATVAIGHRLEPWIVSLSTAGTGPTGFN